jgi:hypothetical protein
MLVKVKGMVVYSDEGELTFIDGIVVFEIGNEGNVVSG